MSEQHKIYLRKRRISYFITKLWQLGILVAFFGFWELSVAVGWTDPFIFSSPSRIVSTIGSLAANNDLWKHIGATLYETVLGFILSTVLGSLIAIILWWSKRTRDVSEPYLIVLNALPKIALGPIIIIWVGAGKSAIVTMALLICLIITIISMLGGFLSVDKEKIQLLKSMSASKWQILTKLVLPANIPTLVSVLKINVGLAWVGTIMGEYLVSREGLGYLIVYGSQIFNLDLVMASTLILCVLAGLMYAAVALVEKWIKSR